MPTVPPPVFGLPSSSKVAITVLFLLPALPCRF